MYEHHSGLHRVRVIDGNGVRLLKFERNEQSSMRLDDPFETDIQYVGYLHLTLAVKPNAARALAIGLGGGSVVKRMWRDYPAMHIDVAEIDPEVIEVAYAFFELPDDERLHVTAADGRDFLLMTPATYDIIIVDAFNDDHIPRPLMTEEFLRLCRDRMSEDGVIAYNTIGSVYGSHSKPFRSLHRTVSNVWRNVWTFPTGIAEDTRDNTRNIILLASHADLTEDELLARIASRVDGLVTVPAFERFGEDLYRGKVRTGDVPLLLDEQRGR
ncbi:MAG: fused MFS/spermidine synthase [Coriobacteriia bacterium]|nr:fused MFS/spermidine synthase [Coriobacteriia bacterium]MBN2822323.1 fused MFS/spermidine synthase [Coriobacteriia bacterium]